MNAPDRLAAMMGAEFVNKGIGVDETIERLENLLANATEGNRIRNWQAEMERSSDAARDMRMYEIAEGSAHVAETLEACGDLADALPAMLATLRAQAAEIERLRAALTTLVAKLDECDPHITDAFVHRYLRCGDYDGPDYSDELSAARAALGL